MNCELCYEPFVNEHKCIPMLHIDELEEHLEAVVNRTAELEAHVEMLILRLDHLQEDEL